MQIGHQFYSCFPNLERERERHCHLPIIMSCTVQTDPQVAHPSLTLAELVNESPNKTWNQHILHQHLFFANHTVVASYLEYGGPLSEAKTAGYNRPSCLPRGWSQLRGAATVGEEWPPWLDGWWQDSPTPEPSTGATCRTNGEWSEGECHSLMGQSGAMYTSQDSWGRCLNHVYLMVCNLFVESVSSTEWWRRDH